MHKVPDSTLTPVAAAEVAHRALIQRLQAIHRYLPKGDRLRVGLFARRAPSFEPGIAMTLNWSPRFTEKEAAPGTWTNILLPALARVAEAISRHARGRAVEAFGIPTLPAAAAFGCAFLATTGLQASWKQVQVGHPDQIWSLAAPREPSGFTPRIVSRTPAARDLAVLVSVADDTEPVFAAYQKQLPPLRAVVHVRGPGSYPHRIPLAGQATDVALTVQDGMRAARREYGNIGTVHLFMAVPAGLAVLIGQLLNTFGTVQTYEQVSIDGSGCYKPAALLRPSV